MNKQFPEDILLIIFITITSIVCIITLPLENYHLNLLFYILLGMFLPGYALLAAMYPSKYDLGRFKRIFGSITLSILLTLIFVIISDYNILGITISKGFIIIGVLTILLSIDALEGNMRTSKTNSENDIPNKEIEVFRWKYSMRDIYIIIFLTLLSLVIVILPTKYTGYTFYPLKSFFSLLLIFSSSFAFWTAVVPISKPQNSYCYSLLLYLEYYF